MGSRTKGHALVLAARLALAGTVALAGVAPAAARSQTVAPSLRTLTAQRSLGTLTAQRSLGTLTAQRSLGTLTARRSLRVTGRGFSGRASVVVAQCGTAALRATLTSVSTALDDCDQHFVAVGATDANGMFAVHARAAPTIETSSGPIDCRRAGACVLGALNLDALQRAPLQVAVLPLAFSRSARDPRPRSPGPSPLGETYPSPPLGAGRARRVEITAHPAAGLGNGRVGQLPALPARPLPRRGELRGEGLLALTMSAPETDWADPSDTSVVVQARVDHGPWQQIVLFAGARTFTYEGFTGPLRTGRHSVTVRVRRDLSHVTRHAALVVIAKQTLLVVPERSAAGRELAHAPVLYGRRASTTRDTPLITYATDTALSGGRRRLTYVVTWSREDAGTGFVPWLEWGTWGRMTDIETAISMTLGRRGQVSTATYLTCVPCGPHFPENRTALAEGQAPFAGRWFAGHPVLRVATGNDDLSDRGTTALRFQQALAAPPAAGDTREGAMDRNPWTYAVMGSELQRERVDYSTSAGSTGPGDPHQYLIIALDTVAQGAAAVGVDIAFAGSSTIYSNDAGTTYPLYRGGNGRTVVKVPLAEVDRPIRLLRLRVLAASPAAAGTLAVARVRVLQYAHGRIVARHAPAPRIVTESPPPAIAPSTPSISAVSTDS